MAAKAFAILASLLALASADATADWVKVSVSAAGDTYVDAAARLRTGDKVTMSEMTDYKIVADPNLAYKSVKRIYEFDCKAKQLRALSMMTYAEPMGRGNTLVNADSPDAEWGAVIAGSVGDIMWRVACARQSRLLGIVGSIRRVAEESSLSL